MRTTRKWIGILLIAVLCLSMVTGLAEGKTTGSIRNDVSGNFATVYSEARGDAATEMTIPAGTSLGEVEVSGDWVKVNYLGLTNYVHKDDVVLTTDSGNSQNNEPKSEEEVVKTQSDYVWPQYYVNTTVTGKKLTLLQNAEAGSGSLGEYVNGTPVTIISWGEPYVNVQVDEKTGYMDGTWLTSTYLPVESEQPQTTDAYTNSKVVGNTVAMYRDKNTNQLLYNLPNGTLVTKYPAESNTDWTKVSYNGTIGYIQSTYISDTKIDPDPAASTVYVKSGVVGQKVKMYSVMDTNTTPRYELSTGTPVTKISESGQWTKVRYNNTDGYILTTYISTTPVTPDPGTQYMYVATDSGTKLTLFTSENINSNPLGSYSRGTKVTLVTWGDAWSKVTVDGRTGFMDTSKLTFDYVAPDPNPGTSYMYVKAPSSTQKVTLYASDNVGSTPLGSYGTGTRVTLLSWGSNWCFVSVDGKSGYIQTQYLSYTDPGGDPNTTLYVKTASATQKAPLYREASTTTLLGTYVTGTRVTLIEWGSTWSKVRIDGVEGFMQTQYLTTIDPGNDGVVAYATVANPDPRDHLNLRAAPSKNATVLGKFYNGTSVKVFEKGAVWCRVEVSGIQGYMMTDFLAFTGTPNPNPSPSPGVVTYATVNNPNSNERLNLRAYPSKNAGILGRYYNCTSVTVYEHGPVWCRVEVCGIQGYMMTDFLKFGNTPTPPMPGPIVSYATVKNPVATQRLNLRATPSKNSTSLGQYYNGTLVKVMEYKSDWCYVEVNGKVGYMMTYYLSFDGGSGGGGSTTPTTGIVKNPVATQRLNLRALPSTSSRSLGQYSNGTVVKILEYKSDWCRVEIGGIYGYMMTKYLTVM